MSLFGVEINAKIDKLNLEIRLKLSKNNHLPSIRTLKSEFLKYDKQNTGIISIDQFQKSLNKNSIFFKPVEFQYFNTYYSSPNNKVKWSIFLNDIRIPMNNQRRGFVNQVFDSVAASGTQFIQISKINQIFDPKEFNEFKNGKKSRQTIWKQFLNLFHIDNNKISRKQFIDFYDDLNVNLYEDIVFNSFLSSTWSYQTRKSKRVTRELIKSAIKQLRFKLIQKTQGPHEQYLLRILFDGFDELKRGALRKQDLHYLLVKLECPLPQNLHEAVFNHLDRNKTGLIEYGEFHHWMFFDQYPI